MPIQSESINLTTVTAIAAVFGFANLWIALQTGDYFGPAALDNPLLHTWSLSVEFQFYLVFPLLLVVLFRLRNLRGILLVMTLLLLTVLSFSSLWWSLDTELVNFLTGFYGPLARAWEFLLGAIAFVIRDSFRRRLGWRFIPSFGVLLILVSVFLPIDFSQNFISSVLIPTLGTFLVLMGNEEDSRVLGFGPIRYIGDISYSLYLWHWPVVLLSVGLWGASVTTATIAVFTSVGLAILSYYFVELPFQGLAKGFRLPWTAATFPILILALMVAAGVGTLVTSGNPQVRAISNEAGVNYIALERGCQVENPEELAAFSLESCTWSPNEISGPRIFLFGDSNATHFGDGLIQGAVESGREISVFSSPGCPAGLGGVVFERDGASQPSPLWPLCKAYGEAAAKVLQSHPQSTVIFSHSSQYFWMDHLGIDWGSSGVVSFSEQEKLQAFQATLELQLRDLSLRGHEVFYIASVPHLLGDGMEDGFSCNRFDAVTRAGCKGSAISSVALTSAQGAFNSTLSLLSARGAIELWDLTSYVCPRAVCVDYADGLSYFRDSTHISVSQSVRLATVFARLIQETPTED